jgi:hypothetical protein
MTTYGLVNLGRDDEPGSTTRIDLRILHIVKEKMPSKRAVVFFVEINEGDDNDEKALIRRVFPNWQLRLASTREPILLSPDWAQCQERVRWVGDTAVEHWSPVRSVGRVFLPDNETLFSAHYAAGANGQGDRPSWARGPLQTSWDNLDRVHKQLEQVEYRRGRNVSLMEDRNAYTVKVVRPIPGQRTVVHERTDWGMVRPAEGNRSRFRALAPTRLGLDSHFLLRMQGTYSQGRG